MKGVTLVDRDDDRGLVQKRLVALAIDAVLIIGAALVFGLLVLGPHVEHWTGDAVGAPGLTKWLWWTAQWPILLAGLLFAFVRRPPTLRRTLSIRAGDPSCRAR